MLRQLSRQEENKAKVKQRDEEEENETQMEAMIDGKRPIKETDQLGDKETGRERKRQIRRERDRQGENETDRERTRQIGRE